MMVHCAGSQGWRVMWRSTSVRVMVLGSESEEDSTPREACTGPCGWSGRVSGAVEEADGGYLTLVCFWI